jgi:hypothetical protein
VNAYTDDMSVLLGRGDGTFAPEQRSTVGGGVIGGHFGLFLSADFNGDGYLDIATLTFASDQSSKWVSVLLGLGDGTFASQQRATVGDSARSLRIGDFNRDGRPDLATANFDNGDVSILLGLGDGTFEPQQRFAVQGHPSLMLSGDFNGDGRLDLLTMPNIQTVANEVSILLGLGDGTFAPGQHFTIDAGTTGFVLSGDFNGDGHPDVATVNMPNFDSRRKDNPGTVSVLLGRGDGTFVVASRSPVMSNTITSVVAVLSGLGYGPFALEQNLHVESFRATEKNVSAVVYVGGKSHELRRGAG